jgi:non-ribosomal peptide synthase protein (TIGR01720 family)
LQRLLEHHEALRLRFRRGAAWTQEEVERETHDVVEIMDLSMLSPTRRSEAMRAKADELQRSLDLGVGPLVRVAYFHFGSGQPGRLLAIVHHLVVDPVSWRVLLEDLERVYGACLHGDPLVLPAKTTSFKEWANRLRGYAGSDRARAQLGYWMSASQGPFAEIPVDHPGGENRVGTTREVRVTLTEGETRELLHEVPRAYGTQVDDVLLTALARTLAGWTGGVRFLIDLERHGREPLFDDVDLSRTVGWFTSLFPVALDVPSAWEHGALLLSMKEQLRRIPDKGIGYGILRYLSEDDHLAAGLRELPQPTLSFNYLGQVNDACAGGSFRLMAESAGPNHSERAARARLVDIVAVVMGRRLEVSWMYSEGLHERATIEAVAGSFLRELRGVIAHCLSSLRTGGANGGSPSSTQGLALQGGHQP